MFGFRRKLQRRALYHKHKARADVLTRTLWYCSLCCGRPSTSLFLHRPRAGICQPQERVDYALPEATRLTPSITEALRTALPLSSGSSYPLNLCANFVSSSRSTDGLGFALKSRMAEGGALDSPRCLSRSRILDGRECLRGHRESSIACWRYRILRSGRQQTYGIRRHCRL